MAVYQVTLQQTQDSVNLANVLHYETSSTPSTSDIQALVDEIRSIYVARLDSGLHSEWTMTGALVRLVTEDDQPSIPYSFTSGPYSGSAVGTSSVRNVAVLLSKVSNTTKPNRGRMYVGGTNEAIFDGSDLVSGAQSYFQSFCNDMLAIEAPEGVFWSLVIVRWGISTSQIASYNAVESFTVNTVAATQRRRLRK